MHTKTRLLFVNQITRTMFFCFILLNFPWKAKHKITDKLFFLSEKCSCYFYYYFISRDFNFRCDNNFLFYHERNLNHFLMCFACVLFMQFQEHFLRANSMTVQSTQCIDNVCLTFALSYMVYFVTLKCATEQSQE